MSEVSSITKTEAGAYVWTEIEEGPDGAEVTKYSTNEDGCGIWQNGQQILGTSQFNLADCGATTRRARVARFMAA